ncbi:DNA cytosine methyltransferase [Actinotignum urinale]|uniref:DNA cytosine methyltransferase n=1 Tax=Actinotignum urinale TaxID=190146 RepID=UPI0003B6A3DE|nr:DNA (cytosine-5-)-methyltransferase [Actinotignum urinale]MDY5159656.1 DNA (cytosine-5-)-methyltransferase [Actinotignum urinale]
MTNKPLTLGSLFDGSGGFPLAALQLGMRPVWACEIEPFAIRVTTKKLPQVAHFGDIQTVSGKTLPPVDIVTFGSPCQDLSIAGRREGIQGTRSNLFYEAIRIIKEMRCETDGQYPKYAVWENVPGAFSSNKGQDFASVLEAFCQLKGYSLPETRPDKWHSAGEIVADDFSLGWRVLDAQYFGVPQRRKRIFLVADLTSPRAGRILFESQSLPRHPQPSSEQRQTAPSNLGARTDPTSRYVLNDQGGAVMHVTENQTGTLRAETHGHVPLVFDNHAQDARYTGPFETNPTITSRYGTGGNNQPLVMNQLPKAYAIAGKHKRSMFTGTENDEATTTTSRTIDTKGGDPCCNQGGMAVLCKTPSTPSAYAVRRLTPIECARLQGFPDDWCENLAEENPSDFQIAFWKQAFEIYAKQSAKPRKPKTERQVRTWLKKPYSDTAAYKLWGNGVALPCVRYVLGAILTQHQK